MATRPLHRSRAVLLAAIAGAAIGLAGFTFSYAEGLSYFSTDPKACTNCHIMNDQYASWAQGPHHAVARCVDCHLPHEFVRASTSPRPKRLPPLQGVHAAGLPRADPDQAAQRADPAGELPALPRRLRARHRAPAARRSEDDGAVRALPPRRRARRAQLTTKGAVDR